MSVTRRACITGLTAVPVAAIAAQPASPLAARSDRGREAGTPGAMDISAELPAKAEFGPMAVTYLDSGTMHPFSAGAKRAVRSYMEERSLDYSGQPLSLDETHQRIREKFARLINASPSELCIVQSTTAGEHLVVHALDIPATCGKIVTDTLHFPGSYYLYEALGKQGMDVVWIRPLADWSIDVREYERAITADTRLVALSLVSTVNGFQHDLKAICEIAHAKGAYVYADIIHAAGSTPVDVKASGVDFAASASYKWLMGDFGLGFLYVRSGLLDRLPRSQYGYEQLDSFTTHVLPFDPPGKDIADYTLFSNATGHFATGTTAATAAVHVEYSLDYILRLGVESIQAHRQPLLQRARAELTRMGYQCITPAGTNSPLLSFAHRNPHSLEPRLARAKVKISLWHDFFRICPSVFNDMADIDRLLEALS